MDKDNKVCINNKCINIEIAQKPQELTRGLQYRTELDKDSGMLFIFKGSNFHSFWMKNVLIPLDMIWINDKFEIVHIENSVPPCKKDPCKTYSPNKPTTYVLEVDSGYCLKKKIKLGDKVNLL